MSYYFFNLPKNLTPRFKKRRLLCPNQITIHITRLISGSPVLVPSHQQIANLLLEQKSADQALQTFKWASEIPGFTHTPATYRALIHKLCTFRRFKTVEQLLDEIPDSIGSGPDDDIFITLVRGFGRARMTREVIKVLDWLPKFGMATPPSLKLLNSILDVLVKEDIDIAREFYRRKIIGNGVKGDDYTYGILMKGLCLTNRIGDGFKLLQVMKTHGVKVNAVVYNTLIYALCKNGKVGRARSLISEMESCSEVTFNILISRYCNENNIVQALVMVEKCFGNGFAPDTVTVTKVLEILCDAGRVLEAVEVLERSEEKKRTIDIVAYNTLIKGFIRIGKMRAALGHLRQMEMKGCLPNTNTYNILIAGFCELGMLGSALDFFHEMKRSGVTWNFVTFNTLIYGLCSDGRIEDGLKILESMQESGGRFVGHISPYNSIIYGLYKRGLFEEALEFLKSMRYLFPTAVNRSGMMLHLCENGDTEGARKVLDEMTKEGGLPSALIYASLIKGFCEKGSLKEAIEMMNQMIRHGYFPIALTFNAVITCLSGERKVATAQKLLEDLMKRGYSPDSESYGLIIDAFCCAGELQKALMLFLQMVEKGVTPDNNSWNSMIRAIVEGTNAFQEHALLEQLTET